MFDETVIEYPSAGTTYSRPEYGVYGYGTYPSSSVLAGQQKRVFLGSYETLEEAQTAYPEADWYDSGSGFQPPYLGHLPDGQDL